MGKAAIDAYQAVMRVQASHQERILLRETNQPWSWEWDSTSKHLPSGYVKTAIENCHL